MNNFFAIKKLTSKVGICSLLDRVDTILRGLRNVGEPIESWSTIVCYWVMSRLDDGTKREFENAVTDNTRFPEYITLKTFLENRAFTVEERSPQPLAKTDNLTDTKLLAKDKPKSSFAQSAQQPGMTGLAPAGRSWRCYECPEAHKLIDCPIFRG